MADKKIQKKIDILFKEQQNDDASSAAKEHKTVIYNNIGVGPSSLYGRRGDNITFHTRGAYVKGYWQRQWSWVWKDFREAFFGLLRIFFSKEK